MVPETPPVVLFGQGLNSALPQIIGFAEVTTFASSCRWLGVDCATAISAKSVAASMTTSILILPHKFYRPFILPFRRWGAEAAAVGGSSSVNHREQAFTLPRIGRSWVKGSKRAIAMFRQFRLSGLRHRLGAPQT